MNRHVGEVVAKLACICALAGGAAHGAEPLDRAVAAMETSGVKAPTNGSSRRVKDVAVSSGKRSSGNLSASAARSTSPRDRDGSVDRPLDARGNQTGDERNTGMALLVRRAVVAMVLSGSLAIALLMAIGRRSGRLNASGSTDGMELLATLSLAPRCCVSLIRAQQHTVLVARDASGVKQMIVLSSGFDAYLDLETSSSSLTRSPLKQH